MSKVGEYFREQQELGLIPTEEEMSMVDFEEPTDDELAEIESKLNQTSFEDINWD